MTSEPTGAEPGMRVARARALAVLRVRGRAVAAVLLPAAVAVVLFAAAGTGRAVGGGWDALRWGITGVAVAVLAAAAVVAALVTRAAPAVSPTVPIAERTAPDLYRLVRDLAERLDVPAPSAIAITPDCDSWLEDRTHLAGRAALRRPVPEPPELVIGSPFLWWMRVAELRAVLAPVVAGTGPSAQPDIAAARRFVRGLDAAVAVAARHRALGFAGWAVRALLRACRDHAAEMERGVAAAASARAQSVDYGLRIVAQEQVGLAYAGWDRLLTRVALPAWRMGRWPSRLDAGVVSALTELSRRDRLAEGFTSRLGERPACDLLDEPGLVDEAASLLAARLFHGGPAERGPDWAPVDWEAYPEEVVDRKWRLEAARLHRVLDELPPGDRRPDDRREAASAAVAAPGRTQEPSSAATGRARPVDPDSEAAPALEHTRSTPSGAMTESGAVQASGADRAPGTGPTFAANPVFGPTLARVVDRLSATGADDGSGERLAARLEAEIRREEQEQERRSAARAAAARRRGKEAGHDGSDPGRLGGPDAIGGPWGEGAVPLFPLQAPRSGRELLADHVLAMVCCAAVDTAGAVPGLDWLDGPVLLFGGVRGAELGSPVLSLVEEGDATPLRDWLGAAGVRPEKPVRLV